MMMMKLWAIFIAPSTTVVTQRIMVVARAYPEWTYDGQLQVFDSMGPLGWGLKERGKVALTWAARCIYPMRPWVHSHIPGGDHRSVFY